MFPTWGSELAGNYTTIDKGWQPCIMQLTEGGGSFVVDRIRRSGFAVHFLGGIPENGKKLRLMGFNPFSSEGELMLLNTRKALRPMRNDPKWDT